MTAVKVTTANVIAATTTAENLTAVSVSASKDGADIAYVPGCQSPCCRMLRDRYRRRSGECAGGEGQSI